MNKLLKYAVPGIGLLSLLVPGSALAQSPPAASKPPAMTAMHHACAAWEGHIATLTPAVATVTMAESHKTAAIDLLHAAVQAGLYPASSAVLRQGERVLTWTDNLGQVHLMALPMARGHLQQAAGGRWTLISAKHGTDVPLPTAGVPLAGTSQLAQGQRVMVFGTGDASHLHPSLIAAVPTRLAATVQSVKAGKVTLQTVRDGVFTSAAGAAFPFPHTGAAPGLQEAQQVKIFLTPGTRQVLAIMPVHHRGRRMHILQHNAYGQLMAATSDKLRLKTAWGEETISLKGITPTVVWPGHPGATVAQISVGLPVLVHFLAKSPDVVVRVLPPVPSSS